jgi:hypothetical protein
MIIEKVTHIFYIYQYLVNKSKIIILKDVFFYIFLEKFINKITKYIKN